MTIVDLVQLNDTQPEDLERPQTPNTDAWVILVFRLLRLPLNVPHYLFHLRIAVEIQIFQASLYVQNCLELSSRRSGSTWLQTGSTIYADLRTLLRWSNERRHGLRMLWCYVYSANSKAGEGKIILKSMLVKRGLRVLIVFNVLGLCPLAFTWFRCCENPCASHSERIVWQRGWVEVSPFTGRILSLNYTTVVTAELDGPAWRKRKQLIEVHTTRKKWMMKDVKWYGGSVSILWGESAGAWGLSIISVYVWG